MELQARMLEAVKHIATSAGAVEHETAAAFREFVPQPTSTDKLGRAAEQATKAAALSIFRRLVLEFAQDAMLKGQPPLQYRPGKAAEPVLQRLLSAALWCNNQELIEAASFLSLVDDLQEVCTLEHCMDIITWLEDNIAVLASPQIADAPFGVNSFTRVCNGILKRLGKHEVISKARLLMLIATITPLFDRSGLGITGAFAPPDPPIPEQVPENAVDSTGKPVDMLLYKHFWNLQSILQNPLSALNSLDQWAAFKKELSVVLENLARIPATVNAARSAAADTPLEKEYRDEGGATQCYLSSYKLFGLQLTDSAFRRDFLVQVLIMLRTLLIPGKVPADTLKPKQRMEALALEKEVFKVLELTPKNGKEFSRAIKDVLERETTWVSWKKGGAAFVIPGKEPDAVEVPTGSKKPQQVPQTCVEWSKPPVASLADAVAKANSESARQAANRKRRFTEGLQLKEDTDRSGRQYDNQGVPPEHAVGKRNTILKLLENNSSVMFWAQARINDRSLLEQPLLAGMKVTEQLYPTSDAVAAQALREMDPDVGIEPAYRRIAEDAVYRWRVGRIAAHGLTDWDGVEAQKVEDAVREVMPDKVPAALKAQIEQEKAEKAAKTASSRGVAPPRPEQQASKAGAATAAVTVTTCQTGAEPASVAAEDGTAETSKVVAADGSEERDVVVEEAAQDPPEDVPDRMEMAGAGM